MEGVVSCYDLLDDRSTTLNPFTRLWSAVL